MFHKILICALFAATFSAAAWDLFPVQNGTGASIKLENQVNYYNEWGFYGKDVMGSHSLKARFFTHNFEIVMRLYGYQWSDSDNYGAKDLDFSFRYRILTFMNIFLDIDGIPWGRSDANTRYIKVGTQFGGPVSKHIYLGSEFAFKNAFEKNLDSDNDVTINQGGILNWTFEIDYSNKRWIVFSGIDFEVQLNDTEYSYDDCWDCSYDGDVGNLLLQLYIGVSYAITKRFSIEQNNIFSFQDTGVTINNSDYIFGHTLTFKYDF